MNGCIISKDLPIFQSLKKKFGNDDGRVINTLYSVIGEDGKFNDTFQAFVKAKRKTTEDLDVNTASGVKLVNDVIQFSNLLHPDGNDTVLDYDNEYAKGYSSVADKRFCQRIVANEILDIASYIRYEEESTEKLSKSQFANEVRYRFAEKLKERCCAVKKITEEEFNSYWNEERAAQNAAIFKSFGDGFNNISDEEAEYLATYKEYLEISRELLGKNITLQDQNLIATLDDMLSVVPVNAGQEDVNLDNQSKSQKFFDVVFRDSRLNSIRKELIDNSEDETEAIAQDNEDASLGENDNENDDEKSETYDESFRVFENHDGQYKTFMIHLGEDIKGYFDRLKRLNSTGFNIVNGQYEYNYDNYNAIGIADTMTASECAMIMYTQADYTSVDHMIESVKRIAEQVPGFESFIQFYNELKEKPDFAYQCYNTFGKMVISKKETAIINGELVTRVTNKASSRTDAIRVQFINDFKTSVVAIDDTLITEQKNKIDKLIKAISVRLKDKRKAIPNTLNFEPYNEETDNFKADKAELVQLISSTLHSYFPTIEYSTILSYINNNVIDGNVDIVANSSRLLSKFDSLIKGIKTTRVNYTQKQYESSVANKHNREIRSQALESNKNPNPKDLIDVRAIWNEGYFSREAEAAAIDLANELVNHAVIKMELNSRNAAGKLSSDVINNNMISNLKSILESSLNNPNDETSPLERFKEFKFRGKQYINSNILLEHDGNKGLFRIKDKVGDKIVIEQTEYATSLLKFHLFNGVQNLDNGDSILYSGMSRGDYVATAMQHYFKGGNLEFADYFLRTPSDAPKNFLMTAPRYSFNITQGNKTISLYEYEDKAQRDVKVNKAINAIAHIDSSNVPEEIQGVLLNTSNKKLLKDTAIKLLTGSFVGIMPINEKQLFLSDDKTKGYCICEYTEDKKKIELIVEGDVVKKDGDIKLTNVKLVNVLNNSDKFGVLYPSNLNKSLEDYFEQDLLKKGEIKRKLNRNHPLFKQMVRVAHQEFQDAATAIDKLFDHINGVPKLGETLGTFKLKDGITERRVATNYHTKNSEYVDSDGTKHKEKGIIQPIYEQVVTKTDDNSNPLEWHWVKTEYSFLSGNVFHSDRFTIFDKNSSKVRNYLEEIIEQGEALDENKINLLYGGRNANSTSNLVIDENGNVVLSEHQQQIIADKVEEFINDYISDTIDRVQEFSNLLEDIPHTNDDIAEFILNYRLAYFNCNDLLEGDTKYYKSAQDFLKRAKEVQGSGTPYAIMDITKPMFGQDKVEIKGSYLNSNKVQSIVSKLHDCKQYSTFIGVTIKNTIRQDKETEENLVNQLVDVFTKQGINEVAAREKATRMMEGYKDTKVNDAQSYITFEEWIRRVFARGQGYKYLPLIERILDESQPLSVQDIDEFIQVQKNFYYDQYYDETLGSMRPRQIKNAEFVLVPRLIRGTELEQVYNLMIKHGIDQLNTEETSKAGKANVLTLWNNDGNLTRENVADFEANVKDATEIYDYNYLYTQQETPQHMNSENKAGLQIMKKALDNISPDSPLYDKKVEFMNLYSENIYDSFAQIIQELNIPLDENGNIKITDGKVNGIDYNIFLKRLEDEMVRLGLDSNMMDFITLIEGAPVTTSGLGFGLNTKMPAYLNSTRKKLESVAQAIFNNRITRQKLPGFHAAQITNVGWKALGIQENPYVLRSDNKTRISKENYNKLSKEDKKKYKDSRVSYSKELHYHPSYIGKDGKTHNHNYIEIMIAPSMYGLDANAKKYDKIREDGKKNNLTTEEIEQLIYKDMLLEIQAKKLDKIIGYRIPTEGKQSMAVMKVVGFVPSALGSTIVVPDAWVAQTGSDFDIDSVYGINFATRIDSDGVLTKIKYEENPRRNFLNYVLRNLTKEQRQQLYKDARLDSETYKDLKVENESMIDYLNALDETKFENLVGMAQVYAKDNNLLSYEDFIKQNIYKQNTREARSNRMLQLMIDILESDESLEENLSQSKFTDIINARNAIMSESMKNARSGRSAFDFLDQANYQQDAMSGAKLKARSVIRDTFCSICNTIRPELSSSISIVYKGNKSKYFELKERFGAENVTADVDEEYITDNDTVNITVKHNKLGWSNDNKNVNDDLITVYSSETTAHILDAIKEGPIPNVNDYTFDVYKLFPDLGSDYETAISFMMQPAVTRIVEAYNRNKSIYAKDYTKPVDAAIRGIAKELGIDSKSKPISQIKEELNSLIPSTIGEDFNVLNASELSRRIKLNDDNISVTDHIFDYLVVLQYEKLSNIASKVNKMAGITKPDKFGAKQTIFQTKQIFDDIADLVMDTEPLFLPTGGVSFIDKLYPGISESIEDGVFNIDKFISNPNNDSVYPSLHYFLKYVSATSVKVNQTLFITQHPQFVNYINSILDVCSGDIKKLTEETYNDFEKYVMASLYKQLDLISRPIRYEYNKGIVETDGDTERETARIFGYGYSPDLKTEYIIPKKDDKGNEIKDANGNTVYIVKREDFKVSDINHPSEEDIEAFANLTPAQKIYWIKQNFKDGLVCKYIRTSLLNDKTRGNEKYGTHTIEFIEDGVDKEQVYEEFRKTFMNKNPLLVMAAMDIIKYAFVVEGFQIKRTAVNKVIDNDILTNPKGLRGTGLVEALDIKIKNFIGDLANVFIKNPAEYTKDDLNTINDINNLKENFVRSHSNMREIAHTFINKDDRAKYMNKTFNDIVALNDNEENNDFLISHGFGYNIKVGETSVFMPNNYVKVKFGKNNEVLYKITSAKNPNSNVIYLTPLNLLQPNESSVYSANNDNNKHRPANYFKDVLDETDETYPIIDVNKVIEKSNKLKTDSKYSKPDVKKYSETKTSKPIPINDTTKGWVTALRTLINEHFNGFNGSTCYTEIKALNDYIVDSGINGGQSIYLDGNFYVIYKLNMKSIIPYFKDIKKPIKEELTPVREIIEKVRQRGIAAGHEGNAYTQIFAIDVVNPNSTSKDIRKSDIVEEISTIVQVDKAIRKQARNTDNPEANKYAQQVDNRNIEPTNKSVKEHLTDAIITQAECLTGMVDRLLSGQEDESDTRAHSVQFFEIDKESGEYMSMTDPKVIAMLKEYPEVRRAYLKLILQANNLINRFQEYKNFTYTDDTQHLKFYVDKINEAIKKLEESSILKKAEELYVTEYLAKLSNNPNIQKNIVSLLDGWHETMFLNSYLNDLQDSANPLVQIITSDVMKDIRAKELRGETLRQEFKKYVKDLKEEAARAGFSISWDNLIDDEGKWIEPFTKTLNEDKEKLQNERDTAWEEYKNSTGTHYEKAQLFEKYLQTRLAYNKWKAKYINQQIDDDYYFQYNALEEDMINSATGKFYDVYVEYKMLTQELQDIYSHTSTGDLDEYWENEKERVLRQIRNLLSNTIVDGYEASLKEDLDPTMYSQDPVKRRQQIINSMSSYQMINNYVAQKQLLDEEYFEHTEHFGFREQLKKYQDVIRHYEGRGVPEIELMEIPQYKEAKDWVRKNAYYKYAIYDTDLSKSDTEKEDNKILLDLYDKEIDVTSDEYVRQVRAALNYFKSGVGSRNNKYSVYKSMTKDLKDETGVVDGRKLTATQIAAIKDEQRRRYGQGEDNLYSERAIIHNSSNDRTIYTSDFYKGMQVDGMTNPKYIAIVKDINQILEPAFRDGILHTSELSNDDLQKVLDLFKKLGYDPIEREFGTKGAIKKHYGSSKASVKKAQQFINENVEFDLSEEDKRRFEIEKANAEAKGTGYFVLWSRVNQEWSEKEGRFVPNHLLWGNAKPKKEVEDKYIDKRKTVALRILSKTFTVKETKYYHMQKDAMAEMFGVNSTEYKKWFEENHIYNPNTRSYEPIVCWTISEPNENMPGEWEPTYRMKDRNVKKEHENTRFKPNVGVIANFKKKEDRNNIKIDHEERLDTIVSQNIKEKHSFEKDCIPDSIYDRPVIANQYEIRLKEYVQDMLSKLARSKKAKNYLEKGNIPNRPIKEQEEFHKTFLKELAKGFGWIEGTNGESFWNPNISYDNDYVPDMPMMHQLRSKESEIEPTRFDFDDTIEGQKQFEKAHEDYEKRKEEIKAKNSQIHKALLDRDFESVLEDFILQAAHFNAVQDNKLQLYFGLKMLNDQLVYKTKSPKFWKTPQLKRITSDDSSENVYERVKDENLIKQYKNWMHRVIFNQFKEDPTNGKARLMNILQSITSYNYMTLNIRGGVANVTVGEANIFGEVFAKQYFGNSNWLEAGGIYGSGIGSYFTNLYDETSLSKADAIIKGMQIFDYDERNGVVTVADMQEWTKRIRDLGFAPLSMGEHYMQNRAMFAMMLSHRLVANPKYGQNGEPKYVCMNLAEYQTASAEEALMQILTDEEKIKYNKFKEDLRNSKNELADYIWFRRNDIQNFVMENLSVEKIQEYGKKVKDINEEKEKEFNEAPTLYSQLELNQETHKMGIAAGSRLAELKTTQNGVDIAELEKDGRNVEIEDAYALLGKFKGRVISVNKKIHGNYGKLDAAQIESKWWGGIVMQYHKHIVPGILKRYRIKGYYNEERGTIEKGCRIAFYDFLKAPIDQIAKRNNMTDGERDNLKGVQNIVSSIGDYFEFIKLNWQVMPDYERQNILRNLGDVCGVAVGVLLALLLRLGWDDDDDSFIYNFGLYQADRLASEVSVYGIGLPSEAKKLWSNPVAVESIINDGLNILGTIGGIILEGEDFDPYYHTGRFAGKHKLGVYVERRIPYWRNYIALRDIADNNHYYKLGDNMIGLINVKKIAHKMKGIED